MQNLSNHSRIFRLAGATVSGTSAVSSASVDLSLGEGTLFFFHVATAAANVVVHVAQSPNDTTFQRLAKTVIPTANGNVVLVDLYRPRQTLGKWGRIEVDRGTATALGDIYAMPYNGRRRGADIQPATVDLAQLISPEEAP